MTYASSTVRFLYHQLPAGKQLEFMRVEESLAIRGHQMHVDAVMSFDGNSEVIFRVSFEHDIDSTARDSGSGAKRP